MPSWRRIGLVLAFVLSGTVIGAAASLNLSPGTLGAGQLATPRCTTANLGVLHNLVGSNVASVTVSGLPAACGGGTLQATVNNGTTNSSGSAVVPAAGGSVTITLAAAVPVSQAAQTDIVVVGP
ncbi:MAG TPA: hypothetical protein VIC83_02630 [Candidatus Limnocylindria bacterium]|jgi:hypothetical protein